MSLSPGYGETPVEGDELDALLPRARAVLGEPVTKASVFDLEQAVQDEVAGELISAVLEGNLALDDLLVDSFARDLHRRLYEDIWAWAGKFRRVELNIGVAPEQIAVELRSSIEGIRYRWINTDDWTARELALAVHADVVRIHPFTDGNGRSTRLWADLILACAPGSGPAEIFDWRLDKVRYIEILRRYDVHRDPTELAAFIGTQGIAQD